MSEEINLETDCRFCMMKMAGALNIMDPVNRCTVLVKGIMNFFGQGNFQDDGFPKLVCEKCMRVAQICCNFEKRCRESLDRIKNYFIRQAFVDLFQENVFLAVYEKSNSLFDFEITCRTCIKKTVTIFDVEDPGNLLLQKLQYILEDQTLMNDNMPKIICKHCKGKIELIHSFKQRCNHSFDKVSKHMELKICSENLKVEDVTNVGLQLQNKDLYTINKEPEIKLDAYSVDEEVDPLRLEEEYTEKLVSNCSTDGSGGDQQRNSKISFHTGDLVCFVAEDCKTDLGVSMSSEYCEKTSEANQLIFNPPVTEGEQPMYKICGISFISLLSPHLPNEKLVKKELKHFNVSDESYFSTEDVNKRTIEDIKPKEYKCTTCGEVFFQLKKLRIHEKRHSRAHKYKCHICRNEFSCTMDFRTHMTKKHNIDRNISINSKKVPIPFRYKGKKPFACKICGRPFAKESSLHLHEPIHNGKRPHVCEVCGKSYLYKCSLKEHMCTHITQKQYKCATCGKAFGLLPRLRMHEKVHSGVFAYKCDVCVKEFLRPDQLRNHQKSHITDKRFSCNLCEQRFKHTRALYSHKKHCHSNKLYKCDLCLKTYNTKISMMRHEKTHSNDVSFECKYCKMCFNKQDEFVAHRFIHLERVCESNIKEESHLSELDDDVKDM